MFSWIRICHLIPSEQLWSILNTHNKPLNTNKAVFNSHKLSMLPLKLNLHLYSVVFTRWHCYNQSEAPRHSTCCFSRQEGKQASLAADFSITQFKHIGRLLMVHGRNSYKRSAALGQFVMHRGMIISAMQVHEASPHKVILLIYH